MGESLANRSVKQTTDAELGAIPQQGSAPRDARTHAIIGAAMEVHRVLGFGFLEAVYQEALTIEFTRREIPFRRECTLAIEYKGAMLSCAYRPDFICFEGVIVEIKALAGLSGQDKAQVINYLRASGHELGLLLNFGAASLQFERVVLSSNHHLRQSAKSADNNS